MARTGLGWHAPVHRWELGLISLQSPLTSRERSRPLEILLPPIQLDLIAVVQPVVPLVSLPIVTGGHQVIHPL